MKMHQSSPLTEYNPFGKYDRGVVAGEASPICGSEIEEAGYDQLNLI